MMKFMPTARMTYEPEFKKFLVINTGYEFH